MHLNALAGRPSSLGLALLTRKQRHVVGRNCPEELAEKMLRREEHAVQHASILNQELKHLQISSK